MKNSSRSIAAALATLALACGGSGGSGGATADFTVASTSGAVSSAPGASGSATIGASGAAGFSGAVALAASALPPGASAAFSPASIGAGASSTLTLTAASTTPPGCYVVTVTGTSGSKSHATPVQWTVTSSAAPAPLQTVFLILMENTSWSTLTGASGSAQTPYISGTLLQHASYATNYLNVPNLHPSLPNYLWLEAGTNFGVTSDWDPVTNHQSSTAHLVTLLQAAGVSWRSYQEDIAGTSCPLTSSGLYAAKHNPMVYFDDVTDGLSASSANCIAHVRPYSELATDLANGTVARYNFITPNLCDDMHGASGCTGGNLGNGDAWLSKAIPQIMSSAAYRNGGAIFITWDESEGADVAIGMLALSPKAKGCGYNNAIAYSHSSTLKTMQEIFAVTPLLGGAAGATNLSDLFKSYP